MAIRVLLADESTTIKKAFQLALSDFAVEVKSVPSGLDVVSVSQDFKPDIIFADVLLTKKSGYDVCKEIKAHPLLQNIPVILMWSSFMEFDTKTATQAGYTDKIEKPFDSGTLREVIKKHVVKTQDHPLEGLLKFPNRPADFIESSPQGRTSGSNVSSNTNPKNTLGTVSKKIHQIDLDEVQNFGESPDSDDDFKPVQLQTRSVNHTSAGHTKYGEIQDFEPTSVTSIKLETENYGDFEEVLLVSSETTEGNNDLQTKINSELTEYLKNTNSSHTISRMVKPETPSINTSHSRFDEQLMREEVRLMAEKICWQIIPEITEKLVREELNKLLRNIEKSI